MAELVGVVASSITLGSVVTHLASSIVKLKDCWDQFREAPEDLKWIVREIEIFGHVLADIEGDLSDGSTASILLNSKPARESLELCTAAAQELDIIIGDLGKELESSNRMRRSYAAAKIVMKNNKVEKHRVRLQNVTRLLSLCQQCYTRALLQSQPELIARRVALGISGFSHVSKATSCTTTPLSRHQGNNRDSTRSLDRRDTSNSLSEGDAVGIQVRKLAKETPKESYTWRIKLPCWVTSRALEIAGLKVPDGWKFALRTYNIIPFNSAVVIFALFGNLKGMQELFASGKASPLDRLEGRGDTLLHCAAGLNRNEIFEFLLDQGADPTIGRMNGVTPLHLIVRNAYHSKISLSHFLPRILPRLGDVFYETPEETINGVFSGFHGTAEEFLFLQRKCCPTYYQMPEATRVSVASRATTEVRWNSNIPDLIRAMLGKDYLGVNSLQAMNSAMRSPWGKPLIYNIAGGIGNSLARVRRAKTEREKEENMAIYKSLNNLFCEFMMAGVDIHQVVKSRTPLLSFFKQHAICQRSGDIHKALDISLDVWLTDLQASGLNLENFGRIEKQLMDSGDTKQDIKHRCPRIRGVERWLISISYGSSPGMWRLWWSNYSEILVGEFWELVERQMEVMPGTWPEDTPYKML